MLATPVGHTSPESTSDPLLAKVSGEWSVTLEDSSTWTRPWSFAMTLAKKDASQRPFEYACHEGNYGMANILSAARAEERPAAAGAAPVSSGR